MVDGKIDLKKFLERTENHHPNLDEESRTKITNCVELGMKFLKMHHSIT